MHRILLGLFASCLVLGLLGTAGQTQPQDIDDNDITLAVEQQLPTDEGVAAHLIDVRTEPGIVRLSGGVDNLLAKKERARQAAGKRERRACGGQ